MAGRLYARLPAALLTGIDVKQMKTAPKGPQKGMIRTIGRTFNKYIVKPVTKTFSKLIVRPVDKTVVKSASLAVVPVVKAAPALSVEAVSTPKNTLKAPTVSNKALRVPKERGKLVSKAVSVSKVSKAMPVPKSLGTTATMKRQLETLPAIPRGNPVTARATVKAATNVAQTFVYVLLLQGNYIYVGQSTDIKRRVAQHFSGNGASFTKRHKPIRQLPRLGVINGVGGDSAEREEVLLQMKKNGPLRVRGWKYCNEKLSKADLDDIENNFVEYFSLCRVCKEFGHMASACKSPLKRRRKN